MDGCLPVQNGSLKEQNEGRKDVRGLPPGGAEEDDDDAMLEVYSCHSDMTDDECTPEAAVLSRYSAEPTIATGVPLPSARSGGKEMEGADRASCSPGSNVAVRGCITALHQSKQGLRDRVVRPKQWWSSIRLGMFKASWWASAWGRLRDAPEFAVAVVWVLAFVLHAHTITGSFVWDDRAAVVNNVDVIGQSGRWDFLRHDFWGASLQHDRSHKSYRPLTVATFRLNFLANGFNPMGYHVVNVCMHATVCALVLVLARQLLGRETPARIAALLFLVHPVHVESVTPIVGRADLLCSVLYLGALLVYLQQARADGTLRRSMLLITAHALAVASYLSKEVGLTVLGMFMVCDLYPDKPAAPPGIAVSPHVFVVASLKRLRRVGVVLRLALSMAVVAVVMWLRLLLHGRRAVMEWSLLENEIAHMPSRLSRVLAVGHVHFVYLWKLFVPFRQSYDYGFACITHVTSLLDPHNLLTVATYGVICNVCYRGFVSFNRRLVMPLALMLVSFSPASHVLVFVGAVVAERLLYLPSVGFCILAAAMADMAAHAPALQAPAASATALRLYSSIRCHVLERLLSLIPRVHAPVELSVPRTDNCDHGADCSTNDQAPQSPPRDTPTPSLSSSSSSSSSPASSRAATPESATTPPPQLELVTDTADLRTTPHAPVHGSISVEPDRDGYGSAAGGPSLCVGVGVRDDGGLGGSVDGARAVMAGRVGEGRRETRGRAAWEFECGDDDMVVEGVDCALPQKPKGTGDPRAVCRLDMGGGSDGDHDDQGRWEAMPNGETGHVHRQLDTSTECDKCSGNRRSTASSTPIQRQARYNRVLVGWAAVLAVRTWHHAWLWTSESKVFQNAMKTCPNSAKVINNYGISLLNPSNASLAVTTIRRAIEIFPDYANAHYNLALAHYVQGEHDEAVFHFGRSLRTDTCNLLAYGYMGQSETILHERASSDPNVSAAHRGRWAQRAAAHLDHAIANGQGNPSNLHYRGSLALSMGKPQLAAYFLEKALEARTRAVEEAKTPSASFVKQHVDDLRAAYTYNQLGLAYKALGLPREAEQAFMRGLELEPNAYELIVNLATVFLENNELTVAGAWLERAYQMNPTSQDLMNNMGVLEEKRGAYHKARRWFLKALEIRHEPIIVSNIKRVETLLQGFTV